MTELPPSPTLSDIQSSPAPRVSSLNSGESDPSVMLDSGAGESRFVLDEAAFMAALEEPDPLNRPCPQYIAAIERGFV